MSRTRRGRSGRRAGWIAYPALLGTTAMGTMSSNVINAPLWVIRTDLGMTAQESVLAVSAFTVAMATSVPLAGWLGDRLGVKAFLIAALGVMVLAELTAAAAGGLETLVLARTVQGAACSAIPPCVQTALVTAWPERTAQTMGAWASAIGLGQAVGPPFGGVITEALGWRWVFLVHAGLVLLLMGLLAVFMPRVGRRRPPMHVSAMFWLVFGGASTAAAVVFVGQSAPWAGALLLAVGAVLGWGMFVHLSRRRARAARRDREAPRPLVDPVLLRDSGYLTAAAGAGLAMGSMAVCIVAMPLFLASDLDLGPAQIGVVVLTLALAMTAAGPFAARVGRRRGGGVQLTRGVVLLVVAAPVVTVAMVASRLGVALWVVMLLVVLGLVVAGTGIAFAQSAAATELVLSPAGRSGTAVGIHNMIRFLSMAAGYSGVSLAYAAGASLYVFPVLALMALGLLAALRATRGPRPRLVPQQ
jgi:MFS family permease